MLRKTPVSFAVISTSGENILTESRIVCSAVIEDAIIPFAAYRY